TVLYFLPPAISIVHGILAQTFFILIIILAYSFSKERNQRIEVVEVYSPLLKKRALIVGGLVYLQLILGALMRHNSAGLAIPDFPTMGGYWLPPFNESMLSAINARLFDMDREMVSMAQVVVHFFHRLGGLVVTGSILHFGYKLFSMNNVLPFIKVTMGLILGVVIVQFSLGAITILTERAPLIASFHVVTGAALLGLCTLMVLRVFPLNLKNNS
ncbi:MAG: COX15/CtaA family protein, partial [Candidatus Neomarinimicrobiota bacterium]